ncbi:hypothetical protein OG535_01635 [Kitasatospora sp. NBC_00085]|uniref:hypothetical protein n=1 Tax=unclassified Kitasatospora TaxID=2633591 RepID=UPI00324BC981
MNPALRPFRVEGRAIPLAKYLAEEEIGDLVGCSCIGNEVTIDLSDTHFLISLVDLGGALRLNFHMAHDGPAHARSWSRGLPAEAGSREIARRIALDVATLARELAPLRDKPPKPPRPPMLPRPPRVPKSPVPAMLPKAPELPEPPKGPKPPTTR